ncbi:MAG: hypothetical protein J6D52_02355 [Clostridia bacterium]|nr:hypothetical protein [Clostridia bacterium]
MINVQFLPKNEEKYLSCLRKYLQKRILVAGINKNTLKNIRKINLLSLYINESFPQVTDISYFCRCILAAVNVELIKREILLSAKISGVGRKNIDRRLLGVFLIETAAHTLMSAEKYIYITINEREIRIIFFGKKIEGYLSKLIDKLNANYFGIERDNLNAVCIPSKNTQEKENKREDIKELLQDPLSPIKIHLSHIDSAYYI